VRRAVRRAGRVLAPAAGLVFIGWLDYATDPNLVFWPVYLLVLVPTALTRPWPVAVAYGGLASLVMLGFELLGRPEMRLTVFPYWRAFSTLISFTLVTSMIPKLIVDRQRLAASERLLIRQRNELQTLNRRLVIALEERSVAADQQFAALFGEHAAAVRDLHAELERSLNVLRALRGESARLDVHHPDAPRPRHSAA
jgi:hypothetical protein